MTQDDLTPDEREVLELLRANAPDAPEALASLDDTSRGRVVGALTRTGTGAHDSDEPSSDETDAEPVSESAPASQRPSSSTFADQILAVKVTVAGKQVPVIPSSVAVVVVFVAVILLVRACGGGGNPLGSLADRGMEAVDDLDAAAEEVGYVTMFQNDALLFDAADRVRDDMRTLLNEADADLDDFDDAQEAGEAVAELGASILNFVKVSADATGATDGEDSAQAALDAARLGARLITNDEVLDQAESLAHRVLDAHIKENARRPDSDEVKEFRRAAEDLIDAARQQFLARVSFELERAEVYYGTRFEERLNTQELNEALEEPQEAVRAAADDYDQAVDDFCYFEKRVEWRGGFPSCEWESRPF